MAGWPEDTAPRGAVVVVFDGVAADFDVVAAGLVVVAAGFVVVAEGFVVVAEVFAWGVADRVAVRGADDGLGDSDGTAEGAGAGGREGCAGMPIAGASACTPIRLLPMAIARIAPTTETGQPKPRSKRPRRPDWSTNTGAGAGSPKLDSDMSDSGWCADPRSMEVTIGRTLRGLSVQGT
ncbi:hypothetical protein PV721_05205 [Streptomyces sp. MB09-01]|uniref:hypothetical protein n=1 Tax=Streptomyces sp. MB09-01 TaxID=3028666 RepID=UPI0029A70B03|nr:hypothetical protein [Streptomyces sp. MB09-01]MDX3533771.1 hypothetical protein [Streptomyces sp. MB09-01]